MNTLESHSAINPYSKTDECAKFVIDTPTDPFKMAEILSVGQEYTLSFWIKSEAGGLLSIGGEEIESSTDWAQHALTFTALTDDLSLAFTSTDTYYIYHPQLEIGNKATDWRPAPEDAEDALANESTELHTAITEQNTSTLATCKSIIFSALESYVQTGDYETFKQTVETQLEVMAGEISMNFTTTTEQITSVDGDMQSKFSELYKHITFSDEGITIGSSANGITLNLDNDQIVFSKNGTEFGRWDGNDFYTGNIVVEVNERAQFGNFAAIPRNDGSLAWLKVK